MPYKPSHVANSFLNRAKIEGVKDVDHLKLQKLVYCMHGWSLAVRGEALVGELFEAWPYGPVLSSLYQEFKGAGRRYIDWYAVDVDPISGEDKALMVGRGDEEFYGLFDVVWDRYKDLSGLKLSSLTHAEGTPWSLARSRCDSYLDNGEIQEHFVGLARRHSEIPA